MDSRSRCGFAVLDWLLTIPALREKEGRAKMRALLGRAAKLEVHSQIAVKAHLVLAFAVVVGLTLI
jgi:hypothetical protein